MHWANIPPKALQCTLYHAEHLAISAFSTILVRTRLALLSVLNVQEQCYACHDSGPLGVIVDIH